MDDNLAPAWVYCHALFDLYFEVFAGAIGLDVQAGDGAVAMQAAVVAALLEEMVDLFLPEILRAKYLTQHITQAFIRR
jgi:hypothetical protein